MNHLKTFIITTGIRQSEIAKALGVSKAYISQLAKAPKCNPQTLARIGDLFGYTVTVQEVLIIESKA